MKTVTLADNLYDYIINDSEFKTNVLKVFNIESTIVGNIGGQKRVYGFIGNGCGITYLKIDKRSKKSIELKDVVYAVRRRINNTIYNEWFSDVQKNYFENFGCPILAVLQQDQQIQIEFYHLVVKYAKEVLGIKKINYISHLD